MKVELSPCFILHHRDYRENSLLLDIFSREHGRLGLVAKGIKNNKRQRADNYDLYQGYLLSWTASPISRPISASFSPLTREALSRVSSPSLASGKRWYRVSAITKPSRASPRYSSLSLLCRPALRCDRACSSRRLSLNE